MIQVKREGVVLEKTSLEFEDDGVLNPAVIAGRGKDVHMFYRAVRTGNYSTIGYCRLDGPLHVVYRQKTPIITPQYAYETHGIEDPRIVEIDHLYYLTYTGYDGVNALGALAISADLKHFHKKGIVTSHIPFKKFRELISHQRGLDRYYFANSERKNCSEGKITYLWDKNLVFFPRKIHGQYYFMHRIKPDIQLTAIDHLDKLTPKFWEEYFKDFRDHIMMTGYYPHESFYIGPGAPPIETPYGWLNIYHGVECTGHSNVYSACASLLHLDNPANEIARLPYPLFKPETEYELTGVVNKVCFPTGTIVRDDVLYIYYGAADERIACASVSLSGLLKELLNHKKE